MKKNVWSLMALLCVLSFFTACDDDDDKKNPYEPVAGEWKYSAVTTKIELASEDGITIPGMENPLTAEQFKGVVDQALGGLFSQLKTVDFKDNGKVDVVYIDKEEKEVSLEEIMSYSVGTSTVTLSPELSKILGLLPKSTGTSGLSVPFGFAVSGDKITLTIDKNVYTELSKNMASILTTLGQIITDAELLETIKNGLTMADSVMEQVKTFELSIELKK